MDDLYLKLVLEGDTYKFSYFVEKYKNMAFSIAFRISNNREDAEEIVQDAFLKAYRSLDKFRKDSKFSTWLYRIVVNCSLSKVRSKKPESDIPDPEDISEIAAGDMESAYRELTSSERKIFIHDALNELNAEDRLMLTLYYLDENSIEEISAITDIPKENVKMKLYRARNRVFNILNKNLKSEIVSIL
jgi:RNA polymerase sigma factor (sigma-70 family)